MRVTLVLFLAIVTVILVLAGVGAAIIAGTAMLLGYGSYLFIAPVPLQFAVEDWTKRRLQRLLALFR